MLDNQAASIGLPDEKIGLPKSIKALSTVLLFHLLLVRQQLRRPVSKLGRPGLIFGGLV